MNKKIYFITGASGVGKTTLVEGLQKKYANNGWEFLHFDSIEIPTPEEMEREYGSGSEWQKAMTYQWIDRLINETESNTIVFEGQVNLQFIKDGFAKHQFSNYKIVLVDCSLEKMTYRLTHLRNQPELLTEDMKNWLNYLRNQAKEFNVPIINTADLSENEVVEEFERLIQPVQKMRK